MKGHSKFAIGIVGIGLVVILAYRFVIPELQDSVIKDSSDSKDIKATINIGIDNWIGYYPLCSRELRKRMRRAGYRVQCVDDQADYESRMKQLKKGKLQLAVATVDSYLLNGYEQNFPGTIISIIDESKGGDAIVAWKDKIASLDALKTNPELKIAFTPNSPSEHLLRSIAVHFDIPFIRDNSHNWRLESNGSEQALKSLLDKKAYVAVLWEPDVSRALENKHITKLIGTEDTDKLIIDILLANREFTTNNPEIINTLLGQYFRTLKYYRDNPKQFISDAAEEIKLSKDKTATLLKGVSWQSLTDNAIDWFGVANGVPGNSENPINSIESTLSVLEQTNAVDQNILPNNDPYRLTNSQFIKQLYSSSISNINFAGSTNKNTSGKQGKRKVFTALDNTAWNNLREIGTLKIRPIVFQSGLSQLRDESYVQLDKAVTHLRHYPNYRIIIKGHSGTRGDATANLSLSRQRAATVLSYLKDNHAIDSNRLHYVGYGASKPLPKKPGESNRSWQYRLPRVELYLVTEDY